MHQTVEFVLRHGYAILFAWVLAEQIGLPVPATPMLLAMGALAGSGDFSFTAAMFLAVSASLAADTFWYWLGRLRGYSILSLLCRISLEPDSCVRRTNDVFARYGSGALLFAKFIPGLSTVAPPLAGLTHMSLWRFLLADGAGSAIWAGAFAGLGFVFRTQLERIAERAMGMGAGLMVFAAGLAAGWGAFKLFQRKRFIRKLRIARITPEELRNKIEAGESLLIVDLRHPRELGSEEAATLPGALHVPISEFESRHEEIPRDREIVLYCS